MHRSRNRLVQLFYAFQDLKYLYMVMEYMPGGDLAHLLSDQHFDEETAKFYLAESAFAIDALQQLCIVYRNSYIELACCFADC